MPRMTRLQIYVAGSTVLAHAVLLRAYYERPNFYSAAVYISQSTGSLMFLINLALIVTASLGYALQRLFYGPLRAIETEQLYDKAWVAVCETLLAMTIFRDDIGIWFFAMFLLLLGGKVWQWIGEGRVELLEQQPPANPRLFHARLVSSLVLSVLFDIYMMNNCIGSILKETRPGVMIMFGFEYVLLAIASISTLLRYTLSLVELLVIHRQEKARLEARRLAREQARQRAGSGEGEAEPAAAEDEDDDDELDVPGWEEKGRWVVYLDLATDFIKSVVYMGFFMILMAFYGIPIHIMRDLFMTIRSFIKRLNDFVKYRNATRDMNARYPDATAEELGRENTCIVCREEMRPWVPPTEAQAGRRVDERQRAKKLPCGHILHFSCLRSWLERQQVCPTCRRPVLEDANAQSGQNNPNGNGNGNQNQQNRQGQNNQGNMQPQAGQPGQQGQGPPQNRPGNAPGNIRVFNLGPIRIALGRLRVPAQQPGNANQAANNDNMIANFARQMAQDPDQLQQQNQLPTQGLPQPPTQGSTNVPATQILQPAEIQSEIFRLQQIIINSLRALNAQHDQLDHVHALLGELQRLQQASGSSTVGEQEHSVMPPVMPTGFAPMTPQAFFSNGTALRQGDPRLPEGLVLPEGWTLTPLAPNVPTGNTGGPSLSPPQPTPTTSGTAQPEQSASSSMSTTVLQPEPTQQHPPTSTGDAAPGPSGSADKSHESSSLGSSWSFDNTNTTAENSGSSSGVAQRGAEGQTVLRRGATVEDSEDSEQ